MKVLKKYRAEDSTATLYGKEVHKAIEDYLLEGTPIPAKFNQFQAVVDKVKAIPGELFAELPMGLTIEGKYTEFDAPDVWWHGIPDVLIEGQTARIVDWKTSKNAKYADTDQLELLALATFAKNPNVQKVKGALMFLVSKNVVKADFHREQFNTILSKWIGRIGQIEAAMENGVWNPRSSPLCNFCPVSNKDCEYASKR